MDHEFAELLEASSLGSPAARRIRSSTGPEAVEEVQRRMTGRPKWSARAGRPLMVSENDDISFVLEGSRRTAAIVCDVVAFAPDREAVPDLRCWLQALYPDDDVFFDGRIGLTRGHAASLDEALAIAHVLRYLTEKYEHYGTPRALEFALFLNGATPDGAPLSRNTPHRLSALSDVWRTWRPAMTAEYGPPGQDQLPDHRSRFERAPGRLGEHVWLFAPGSGLELVKMRLGSRSSPTDSRRHLQPILERLWQTAARSNGPQTRSLIEAVVRCSVTARHPGIVSELLARTVSADQYFFDTCARVFAKVAASPNGSASASAPDCAEDLRKAVPRAVTRSGRSAPSSPPSAGGASGVDLWHGHGIAPAAETSGLPTVPADGFQLSRQAAMQHLDRLIAGRTDRGGSFGGQTDGSGEDSGRLGGRPGERRERANHNGTVSRLGSLPAPERTGLNSGPGGASSGKRSSSRSRAPLVSDEDE